MKRCHDVIIWTFFSFMESVKIWPLTTLRESKIAYICFVASTTWCCHPILSSHDLTRELYDKRWLDELDYLNGLNDPARSDEKQPVDEPDLEAEMKHDVSTLTDNEVPRILNFNRTITQSPAQLNKIHGALVKKEVTFEGITSINWWYLTTIGFIRM